MAILCVLCAVPRSGTRVLCDTSLNARRAYKQKTNALILIFDF